MLSNLFKIMSYLKLMEIAVGRLFSFIDTRIYRAIEGVHAGSGDISSRIPRK